MSTFVKGVGGRGEDFDREEEEVLCRLVLCKRHFPIVTIVLCVHFIPHYCVDS